MSNLESGELSDAGPFSGPTEFAELIRRALVSAAQEGWSSMVWSDPNFEDWPLGERAVIESLQTWARGGRQLVMLAHNYDSVLRHKPRLVSWRSAWDHIVECRVCKTVDASEMPSGPCGVSIWFDPLGLQVLSHKGVCC